MQVAVKYGALNNTPLLDKASYALTESSQAAVARRLLALFPGAVLIGPERATAEGLQVVPLGEIDAEDTLLINLDVLDSVAVFQRLHRSAAEPRIMNVQWTNPSVYHHPINFGAIGLSYSFFPTFCAGERIAAQVREVLQRWALPALAARARVASAEPGIELDRPVQHRDEAEPIVLYPSIRMDRGKRPQDFVHVVTNVAKRTPIRVLARLAEDHLTSTEALQLATSPWGTVTPLRASRDDYWTELSRTTAFVATADDESFGIGYVEAMSAGVIGILPRRPWALKLVPRSYPFLFDNLAEAESMLYDVVTNPHYASDLVDQAVGGGHFTSWIREHHDAGRFENAFRAQVQEWFGPL